MILKNKLVEKIISDSKFLEEIVSSINSGHSKVIPNTEKYLISKDGKVLNLKTRKFLNPYINNGYLVVNIRIGGRPACTHGIHRLLMLTFIGYSDLVVNHKDGNRLNNAFSNLEYCTNSDNIKHAWRTGLIPDNGRAIVNTETGEVYKSIAELSRALGVKTSTLSMRLNGINKSSNGRSELKDTSMYAFVNKEVA